MDAFRSLTAKCCRTRARRLGGPDGSLWLFLTRRSKTMREASTATVTFADALREFETARANPNHTQFEPHRDNLSNTEVGHPYAWFVGKHGARPLQRDPPLIENIAMVGDLQRRLHVLFDNQDRDAIVSDLLDDLE
jgi:hypothetical protein